MKEWQSSDVVANGLRLHYTRTGDKPAIVLLHGFSDDGPCWTPAARRLEADYDLVMLDARCHGCSDAVTTRYGVAEMAGDVAGVIHGLKLDRPVLMGHSMGGATAFMVASVYPELTRAIIIEDAGPFGMGATPEEIREGRERTRQWVSELKQKSREQLIADEHAASPLWSDEELGPWADSKMRLSLNVLNNDRTPPDWPNVMSKITCPALLIIADVERGGMFSAQQAAEMQQFIPQLRVTHIAGAGHNIRREQFGPYLSTVCGFLSEIYATPTA